MACGWLLIVAGLRGIAMFDRFRAAKAPRVTRDERRLVEALAVWTEQLRDTIAGASGLEQAIVVTSRTAPLLLRPSVEELAARLGFDPLPEAVREFAEDVDHPLADFVAAALITAADNQVREMGALLGHLAQCCRDDVAMRTRIWVARARTRSAQRIISVVVILFVGGLALLQPTYLAPYASPSGMFMASVIGIVFVTAFASMRRLGRLENPVRFIARRWSSAS